MLLPSEEAARTQSQENINHPLANSTEGTAHCRHDTPLCLLPFIVTLEFPVAVNDVTRLVSGNNIAQIIIR